MTDSSVASTSSRRSNNEGTLEITREDLAGAFTAAQKLLPFNYIDNNIDRLTEYAKLVAYEGFDPKVLFLVLQHRGSKDTVLNSFGKDMAFLCITYLERGSKLTKIIESVDGKAKEYLTKAKNVYGIDDNVGKVNKSSRITLARISQVFPWFSCMYAAKCVNHTVSPEHMKTLSSDYPIVMMSTAFPALILCDPEVMSELIDAYLLFQMEFQKVITPNKSFNPAHARSFVMAAINSKYIPEKVKLEFGVQEKLVVTEKVCTPRVTSAAQAYRTMCLRL